SSDLHLSNPPVCAIVQIGARSIDNQSEIVAGAQHRSTRPILPVRQRRSGCVEDLEGPNDTLAVAVADTLRGYGVPTAQFRVQLGSRRLQAGLPPVPAYLFWNGGDR